MWLVREGASAEARSPMHEYERIERDSCSLERPEYSDCGDAGDLSYGCQKYRSDVCKRGKQNF